MSFNSQCVECASLLVPPQVHTWGCNYQLLPHGLHPLRSHRPIRAGPHCTTHFSEVLWCTSTQYNCEVLTESHKPIKQGGTPFRHFSNLRIQLPSSMKVSVMPTLSQQGIHAQCSVSVWYMHNAWSVSVTHFTQIWAIEQVLGLGADWMVTMAMDVLAPRIECSVLCTASTSYII